MAMFPDKLEFFRVEPKKTSFESILIAMVILKDFELLKKIFNLSLTIKEHMSKNSFELRVLISALLLGAFIIGAVTYRTFSSDLKQHFSQKMVELLPNFDRDLAAL